MPIFYRLFAFFLTPTGLKQIHSQLVNYWPITTNEMYIHVYLVVYGYLAVYSCVILGN